MKQELKRIAALIFITAEMIMTVSCGRAQMPQAAETLPALPTPQAVETAEPAAPEDLRNILSTDEAAEYIRNCATDMQDSIEFYMTGEEDLNALLAEAVAYRGLEGKSCEGDALANLIIREESVMRREKTSDGIYRYSLAMKYKVTREQEMQTRAEVTRIVNDVLHTGEGCTLSERERAQLCYEYVIFNINPYGYERDMSETAYGMIISGENQRDRCTADADALYRLCIESGVEARELRDTIENGDVFHAWNELKVDGVWYLTDPGFETENAEYKKAGGPETYQYFLKDEEYWQYGHQNFPMHGSTIQDIQYSSDADLDTEAAIAQYEDLLARYSDDLSYCRQMLTAGGYGRPWHYENNAAKCERSMVNYEAKLNAILTADGNTKIFTGRIQPAEDPRIYTNNIQNY